MAADQEADPGADSSVAHNVEQDTDRAMNPILNRSRDLPPMQPVTGPQDGLSQGDIDALMHADHGDVFSVLGMHRLMDGRLVVRTIQPHADRVWVVDKASGQTVRELNRIHGNGLFSAIIERPEPFGYVLRLEAGDNRRDLEDAYRFWPVLGEIDLHLFGEGSHLDLYKKMGAHPTTVDGVAGTSFAVWAPNARRVSVVGDFNGWDGRCHGLRRHPGTGVWDIFVPHVARGDKYKFEIKGAEGYTLPLKADPFGFAFEHPPATATVVQGLPQYEWSDGAWMASRADRHRLDAPISVYEIHLGSWKRVPEDGNRPLTYRELADQLVPYVTEMGYTHIELLPITEYPFDPSWGYQPIGLFAPTTRFGSPEDFCYLVDKLHQAGIGIILDWVPGHFPSDAHGLGWFDGTHLYEHADPRQGYHQDWNTLIYNYGRNEVSNYLLASAMFWFDQLHIDGIRVDAVASMLYLNYSRKEGEWIPNQYGGNENLEAIAFLRRMNEVLYGAFPGIITIAEESTAWPAVSRPTYVGGLGFGYKWNMGWMHDTLSYISKEPIHRRYHHNDMTFGLLYAFHENFMLPISHDEVVHGKGSLMTRMPGDLWQQFANMRAYFGFMYSQPGKKLLFMGGEIAQRREWAHAESLDWHLLDHPEHKGVQSLLKDLNAVYRQVPALHDLDCDGAGFAWINANDADTSTFAYARFDRDRKSTVVGLNNFTPVVRQGYRLGVPHGGRYRILINTDDARYAGSGVTPAADVVIAADDQPWMDQPFSIQVTLPPLATVLFEHIEGDG